MTDPMDDDPNMADALEVAAQLDAQFAQTGQLVGPLHGVVMAIKDEVIEAVHRIGAELRAAGIRVRIDDRADVQFGRRAIDWELKGVPLRVEIGPKDLDNGSTSDRRPQNCHRTD